MIRKATAAELNQAPYELRSLSESLPPQGSEGQWYRYVIAQGESLVVGIRSGTSTEIDDFLRDIIARLNERRMGKTRPRAKISAPAS